ncbi:tetratricopeptide repeat protein [Uliginosibacterium sp. H3]|uniref:Tetratricopeptide repeat protein n=1 Tax=Uliginosibacterium silvisoli TaxID=3114758 RepID=A0ABU6JZF8_9RHOO|nr:tetratricopeptide repeat protein [Uliginosibacterium sp. H3]
MDILVLFALVAGAWLIWRCFFRNLETGRNDEPGMATAEDLEQVTAEFMTLSQRLSSAAERDDYPEAIRIGERVLDIAENSLGNDPEIVLPLLGALANFHDIAGHPEETMTYLRRGIALRERFPALHDEQADALRQLAALHLQRDEAREALPLIRREVALRRRHAAPDEALLRAQCNLLSLSLEEPAMAEPLRRDVTTTARELGNDAVARLANEANAEVSAALRDGRAREAWSAAEQAALLSAVAYGPEHDSTYVCRSNLAEMLRRNRRFEEAEAQFKQLIAEEETRESGVEGLRALCNNLALLYDQCGRPDDATTWRERQMSLLQEGGASIGSCFNALNNLAVSQDTIGDGATAAQTYAEAFALSPEGADVDPRIWAETANNYGITLVNLKRLPEAGRMHQKVIERKKAGMDIPMPVVAASFNGIGMVYDHLGKLPQAQDMFERALAIKEQHLSADDVSLETGRHNLGSIYARRGDAARAVQMGRLVLASREKRLGMDHPETRSARVNLEAVMTEVASASEQPALPTASMTREDADALMVQITGGKLHRYATYDFGRARDESVSMVLVPEAQSYALQRKLTRALPTGWRCYIGSTRWLGEEKHDGMAELVVIRAASRFDCLRVARTDAVNHDLGTEDIIRTLQDYDRRFGIRIHSAETDSVGFTLQRLPEDLDAFAQELLEFCMDLEDVGLIKEMITSSGNRVELWWD